MSFYHAFRIVLTMFIPLDILFYRTGGARVCHCIAILPWPQDPAAVRPPSHPQAPSPHPTPGHSPGVSPVSVQGKGEAKELVGGADIAGPVMNIGDADTAFGEDDADGGDSSLGGDPLQCCRCPYVASKASQLLLIQGDDDQDASWQGRIWGLCIDCAPGNLDPAAFRRASKKSWDRRRLQMTGRAARVNSLRNVTFRNMREKLEAIVDVARTTRTQIRKLAIQRIMAITMAFRVSLGQASEAMRAACTYICNVYLMNVNKLAKNPATQTSVDGMGLTNSETQMLTNLSKDITLSFLCRSKSCLYFGVNAEWIQAASGKWKFRSYLAPESYFVILKALVPLLCDHIASCRIISYRCVLERLIPELLRFRCPLCGDLFRPFVKDARLIDAQYVLEIPSLETGGRTAIPCTWPGSEEAAWVAQMAEAQARQMETPADLGNFLDRTHRSIAELVRRSGAASTFSRLPFNKSLIENRLSITDWNYTKFSERGWICGKQLQIGVDTDIPVFSNWPELIGLLSHVMVGARGVQAAM